MGKPPLMIPANVRRLENRIIQETKSQIVLTEVITEQPGPGDGGANMELEEKTAAKLRVRNV